MQLITGGMGFIGLHTARSFLDAGGRFLGYVPDVGLIGNGATVRRAG